MDPHSQLTISLLVKPSQFTCPVDMNLKFCQSIGHIYKTALIKCEEPKCYISCRKALLRLTKPLCGRLICKATCLAFLNHVQFKFCSKYWSWYVNGAGLLPKSSGLSTLINQSLPDANSLLCLRKVNSLLPNEYVTLK